MKILLVIPAIGNFCGGTTKVIFSWAEALSNQGINVDIVTTNANGNSALDVALRKWLSAFGYRIQYFPYVNSGDYKWSNEYANWLFRNVRNYDLVHISACFSLTNIPAHWACRWHNIPYIISPHGMLEPWALSYKAWKKRLFYSLFERPALNNAKAIQAMATPEAVHLSNLRLKPPIATIPNGIHDKEWLNLPTSDLFFQAFPNTRNKTLILFLGRIDPKKGLDILAQAFRSIHVNFPQTHLVIAGPDNIGFLPKTKKYFAEVGCLDAVTFTGILIGEIKYSALVAADLYVAPSYSEGFSISILEGMASGLPCVITTGCNFPEAAKANSAYVVEPTAAHIGKAIMSCLKDPKASQSMGKSAQQFIFNNYTWDRIAALLIEVYTSILDHQPVPSRVKTTETGC